MSPAERHAGALLQDVARRLAPPGPLFPAYELAPPTASAMNGAAGLAVALTRWATAHGDQRMLDAAASWSDTAVAALGTPTAFWNADLGIEPETFGQRSLFHTASGVHWARATVAAARGDHAARVLAEHDFVQEARRPCEHLDVLVGRAGLLLGCALLLEREPAEPEPLRALGVALHRRVCRELAHQPAASSPGSGLLGVGHGWAGVLHALLRWSSASGRPPVTGLDERLGQLAALAEPAGRGLHWPYQAGEGADANPLAATWCNGAAGFVHLWLVAHDVLGDDAWVALGERAGWTAYEGPDEPGDLCCGLAGRAYALLGLYRRTGDPAWWRRARELADRAVGAVRTRTARRDSLFKGDVGVAVLLTEIDRPEQARMPLFEA